MITKDVLKELPMVPGVYFMKDSKGEIIYVGKSKKLKNRVSSYFNKIKDRSPKIEEMVKRIESIDYIVTDTELEALLLECENIKRIKPLYNSQMKNDGRYVFIKIDMNDSYPRPVISTERKADEALYFGPFSSLGQVETVLDFVVDYFLIRKCTHLKSNTSTCLYHQLSNCPGVCQKLMPVEIYNDHILKVIEFFEGKNKEPIEELTGRMNRASENMDFEDAVKWRDTINCCNYVIAAASVISQTEKKKNILAFEPFGEDKAKLFLISGHKLLYEETVNIENVLSSDFTELCMDKIEKYFSKINYNEDKLLNKEDVDAAQIIHSYVKGNKNNLCYLIIRKSWLKKGNLHKLNEAVNGLILKLANTK